MSKISINAFTGIHNKLFPAVRDHIAVMYAFNVNEDGGINVSTIYDLDDLQLLMANENGKDFLSRYMRGLMEQGSVIRKGFIDEFKFTPNLLLQINEGWMTVVSTEEVIAANGNFTPPSLSPNREEVLIFHFHTMQGSTQLIYKISNTNGRHVVDEPLTPDRFMQSHGGRFSL